MNVLLHELTTPSPGAQEVEVVERKGIGHPDTICDALAERFSLALSRWYLDRFGLVLHHNVDKALLCGGAAQVELGGGRIVEPVEIWLAGRATRSARGVDVPVERLATESSHQWLRENLRFLEPGVDVVVHTRVRSSSSDLTELFARQQASGVALANDTSVGVGFAPLDLLETVVARVASDLGSPQLRTASPEVGEDIKVMGVRTGRHIDLTVACAFVSHFVPSVADYRQKKSRLATRIHAMATAAGAESVSVRVNAADGEAADSLYLTVSGTSAEAGDDGQVGRGNRLNGLITPCRPMSLEAVAGKNPVSHVGKLYNLAAARIAQALVERVTGVREATCLLVSQIGGRVDQPQVVELQVRLREPATLRSVQELASELARRELASLSTRWRQLVAHPLVFW